MMGPFILILGLDEWAYIQKVQLVGQTQNNKKGGVGVNTVGKQDIRRTHVEIYMENQQIENRGKVT